MIRLRYRVTTWDISIWALSVVVIAAETWGRWGEFPAGLALAGVVVFTGRRRPVWALLVGATTTLVELVEPTDFRAWPAVVCAVGCLLAGRHMPDGLPALLCFPGVALAGLVIAAATGDVWRWISVVLPLLLAGLLPWLIGRYSRLRADLAEAGWQRAEQLELQQRLIAREARLRERTRIAQDMHDSLGNELSLIALRAGALELDRGLEERHRAALGELRAASVDATERLREVIGILRDETDPVPAGAAQESIADLVARWRASGMDIELLADAAAESMPAMVGWAAYRVVQEALTNAAKHAPGAAVTVRLVSGASGIAVTVTNEPSRVAGAPPATGGGRGLVGLRERVRLVGGTLQAGPLDDGYQVVAELPIAAAPVTAQLEDADEPVSMRPFAAARRKTRRGLVAATAVAVGITSAVLLVVFGLRVHEVTYSRLDPAVYDALRLGQQRADIAGRLPAEQVHGRPDVPEPPIPEGARCEYYRVTDELFAGPIDVYRLCFAAGQLVGKDLVPGTTR